MNHESIEFVNKHPIHTKTAMVRPRGGFSSASLGYNSVVSAPVFLSNSAVNPFIFTDHTLIHAIQFNFGFVYNNGNAAGGYLGISFTKKPLYTTPGVHPTDHIGSTANHYPYHPDIIFHETYHLLGGITAPEVHNIRVFNNIPNSFIYKLPAGNTIYYNLVCFNRDFANALVIEDAEIYLQIWFSYTGV